MTPALDVACGPRSFYLDKEDPRVTFCDLHPRHSVLCDGRTLDVSPDRVADFRDLPFPDASFSLVIFDPPHLDRGSGWQVEKYGRLDPRTWHDDLARGFAECLRVLKPDGVLVFKWYEYDIALRDVLSCCPVPPILGNRRPRQSKTHWLLFMRPTESPEGGMGNDTVSRIADDLKKLADEGRYDTSPEGHDRLLDGILDASVRLRHLTGSQVR